MTIFDSVSDMPTVRNRHRSAPLYKERVEYLMYAQALGRTRQSIRRTASHLLQINRTLGFLDGMRPVTIDELKRAARRWEAYDGPLRRRPPGKNSYEEFMRVARSWLRFHSCLVEPVKHRLADRRLREYEQWLRDERGLASTTIRKRSDRAFYFLKWLAKHRVALRDATPLHLERYFEAKKAAGLALATRITAASSLRIFLRYSEARGLVRAGLCEAIPFFARPKHIFTSRGPSWRGVRRLVSSLNRVKPTDIRDRAMVLLMAVYGLRSAEIRGLRISDVDFQNRILTVGRGKTRRTQRFPLTSEVSTAIQKYIDRVRPACECPSLFLTMITPCRPISHYGLYRRIHSLFRRSGVASIHKGPHALRHACANRLMETGTSVRAISAFLGHTDSSSIREYARYTTKQLRQIAEFSLEGLL